jgi:hypothetical protein
MRLRDIKNLTDAARVTDADLRAAGYLWRDLVQEETAEHRDADGRSFKPYTEDYARRKGTGQGNVDLRANRRRTSLYGATNLRSGNFRIGLRAMQKRTVADIKGPHMLDSIEVVVNGTKSNRRPVEGEIGSPVNFGVNRIALRIQGEPGNRARAHNFGKGKMPVRQFLSLSAHRRRAMEQLIKDRVSARVARATAAMR